MIFKTSDFYYDLPGRLIAQSPAEPRDSARLLHVPKTGGDITHTVFSSVGDYLRAGDLLVFNDTKVIPARLLGYRQSRAGGKPDTELLLLERISKDEWETLARPGRRLKPGAVVDFGELKAEILQTLVNGNKRVRFTYDGVFEDVLERVGHTPLPPYITQKHDESYVKRRYNTVYSRVPGSAAAPTAGLHFTPELLSKLSKLGAEQAFVTLHVGPGTFRPVKTDDLTKHHMHSERYILPLETAEKITACKAAGHRVIAVGTTAARVLESTGGKSGAGQTEIFIYPGYDFKVTDGLITNFHLPESTLLMLVSALIGRERALDIYEEAVKKEYRFFSFGDAMMIL